MRDLTEEELELAPDWATHYWTYADSIMFESKEHFQLFEGGVFNEKLTKADGGYLTNIAVNIKNKKPFDITKYKFSEEDIECELAAGNNLLLINNTGYNCIPFSKSDAIAIAKALGVTGEDLK